VKTVKRVGLAVIPPAYHRQVGTIVSKVSYSRVGMAVSKAFNFGFGRYCPCCNAHLRRFSPFGLVLRPEALCPVCGSLDRHRLIYLYLRRRTDLFDGRPKRMLHVAPEAQLSRLFAGASGIDYLSADLSSSTAMVHMDITAIEYPDQTFDVIYCSHVLEHVIDDRKAMRELHRVLRTGGWAILQVPISTAEETLEDPTITSPKDRERAFGQFDHVRRYGADYRDRLEEAGFSVEVDGFARELDDEEVTRFGLIRSEDVYRCTRKS
jgi:SAM-dependent methyltransferase